MKTYKQNRNEIIRGIGAHVSVTVQTRQINATTGKIVRESLPQTNLVMDGGLNALARSTNSTHPAEMTVACRVGDGATSDKTSSGAITFTQAGTTLTASAGFFTAGMVGRIFKWGSGTGGNEVYITAFSDTQNVTVDTSATVAVPEVGVVWNVTRTTLENLLFTSTTHETTAGSCGTTFTANVAAHKRTYNFAQQGSSYNVNEIGYFRVGTGTTIFGRLVLGATEVVAPTNFLQVILTVSVTYSPSVPTAVGDVGTNIDTSGNAVVEGLAGTNFSVVTSTGTITTPGNSLSMDGGNTGQIRGIIATYTQNAVTGAAALAVTTIAFQTGLAWTFATTRGLMTLTSNATVSTAGQTLFGVMCGGTASSVFDVKFTSTFALPTGSFLPRVVFAILYNRSLNN